MATITGFIERIKFRNEENGYTVMSVTDQSDGDEVIMVGTLSYAAEGDMIQASGRMIEHPVYGEQLQIESYEMKTPQDAESMERYLGSGAIKGIGVALAARIVPPWRAMISLAMAKPRPAPPVRVARELSSRKNWSKMRSSFSAGMVRPSLVNVRTTVSASCCPVIRTVDPGKL